MHEPEKYKTFRQRFPELASHLREWCSGNPSRECQSYLLAASTALATKYVSGPLKAAATVEDIRPYILAQSAAVDLLKKPGPDSALCKALQVCHKSDLEFVLAFIPYAVRTIRNAIRRNLKTADPLSFRMFEKMDEACKDARLYGWPESDPQWITCRGVSELSQQEQPWTADEVGDVLSSLLGKYGDKEIEWIYQTVRVVSTTEGHQRFVEIRLLLGELCRVMNHWCRDSYLQSKTEHSDPNEKLEISRAIEQARAEGHERLQGYRYRDRVGQDGMLALGRALDAYLSDFHQDGRRPLHRFDYVADQWPGLTQQQYVGLLRSPFQGAIDFVEQRLRELLKDK